MRWRRRGWPRRVALAIVESELVGGECSYWACMSCKALLRPAELLDETRRVPGAREAVTGDLDADEVLRRRDRVIAGLDDEHQLAFLSDRGSELVRGHGRLDGERRVRVGDKTLTAGEAVVLATGSGAAVPPIPGPADVAPWTNREATTASRVPERLLVLGGRGTRGRSSDAQVGERRGAHRGGDSRRRGATPPDR